MVGVSMYFVRLFILMLVGVMMLIFLLYMILYVFMCKRNRSGAWPRAP